MKLALGIVSLFAGGGLQRDGLRVLEVLRRRGHDVSLFTGRCDTSLQTLHAVTILRPRGFSNHAFDQSFAQLFQAATREGYDAVVGFNKLTGLDVLYCADPSVLAGPLSPFKHEHRPPFTHHETIAAAVEGARSARGLIIAP